MAREVADCTAFSLFPRKLEASRPPQIQDKGMAVEVVELRQRLGDLSGWTSKVQSEATGLSRVIEGMMDLITGDTPTNMTEFSWQLPVWIESRWSQRPRLQYIPLILTRKKPREFGEAWGRWQVDSTRIEAVLSLLMLHYQEAEFESSWKIPAADPGRLRRREDLENLHKTLRILDFPADMDHADALCIYDWWIGRGTACFQISGPVDKAAATSRNLLPYRIVGAVPAKRRGVAVVSVTPLESICAQNILSNFFREIKRFIPIFSGETKVRSLSGRNIGSFRMLNTALERMVEVFISNEFCTIEDAYMTMIPALVEKLPPIVDSQADILNLAKSQQEEGVYDQIEDIEFWLSYTSQWAARQCTRYSWEKSLGHYVMAARIYFRTAQLHSAAANTEFSLEATQKLFEQAEAKLVRACNLVVWRVGRSRQLSHDLEAAEQLFRDILQWLTLREEGWRNSEMGVRRKSTYAEVSMGFSKVLEGRMKQLGDLDDCARAEIEELQLRGRDGDNSKSETDWDIMQQFLIEVDDRLHGDNLNTHAGWV